MMKMKTNFNIDSKEEMENSKQSFNFIEQLQNQVDLCREAMCNKEIALAPRVETLECLLWAKLRNDSDYMNHKEELNNYLKEKDKQLRIQYPNKTDWQIQSLLMRSVRDCAKDKFKAIMIFIDKKGYMPIQENE